MAKAATLPTSGECDRMCEEFRKNALPYDDEVASIVHKALKRRDESQKAARAEKKEEQAKDARGANTVLLIALTATIVAISMGFNQWYVMIPMMVIEAIAMYKVGRYFE